MGAGTSSYQRRYICEVNGTGRSVYSTVANMDNSSINTPKVSTASQQQHQQLSNCEDDALHDLATLFDPAHFLDNTVEFVDPQLIGQDVDSNIQQEAPAVNPEFVDMTDWSEQAMADILSMEEEQQ